MAEGTDDPAQDKSGPSLDWTNELSGYAPEKWSGKASSSIIKQSPTSAYSASRSHASAISERQTSLRNSERSKSFKAPMISLTLRTFSERVLESPYLPPQWMTLVKKRGSLLGRPVFRSFSYCLQDIFRSPRSLWTVWTGSLRGLCGTTR